MKQSNETEVLAAMGKRIANARLEKDMTQAQFARASGIQKSMISRIEAGKCNLTIRTIAGHYKCIANGPRRSFCKRITITVSARHLAECDGLSICTEVWSIVVGVPGNSDTHASFTPAFNQLFSGNTRNQTSFFLQRPSCP